MELDLSSSSILRRMHDGGVEELAKLFELNRDNLRALVRCRVHGKMASRFDESDIVQDAFLRAKNQLDAYLKNCQMPPLVWVRRLCKQMLNETMRKNLRLRRSLAKEQENPFSSLMAQCLVDSIPSVSEAVARQELIEKVKRQLQDLNPCDQEIIEMRHADNLTFPEIATMLEMHLETVKKRYYRALEKLRVSASEDSRN